jgi:hypothetical protein
MIDLLVLVSSLPLVLEVGIGAFGDGEDCGVGGEVLALLRRWVGFWFVLLSCVVWHWIGNLWNWQRVCYLWN